MTQEKLEKIKKEISKALWDERLGNYFNQGEYSHYISTSLVDIDITLELQCERVEDGDGYWTPFIYLMKDCRYTCDNIECTPANEDELSYEEVEEISEELTAHIIDVLEDIVAEYED